MLDYETSGLTTHLFVDDDSCSSSDGKTLPIFSPARPDELVGCIASATPRGGDRACSAAHKVFPVWAFAMGMAKKIDVLAKSLKIMSPVPIGIQRIPVRLWPPEDRRPSLTNVSDTG